MAKIVGTLDDLKDFGGSDKVRIESGTGDLSQAGPPRAATDTNVPFKGIMGDKGPAGDQGPQGLPGDRGPMGDKGPTGDKGPAGDQGTVLRHGITDPLGTLGRDGDFYINTTTNRIWGPKNSGVWSASVSLVGVAGDMGPRGAMGPQGERGPQGTIGPRGLTGPTGPLGDRGPQGPQGALGPRGERGVTGLSAYELAVQNGYTGSLSDWLSSNENPQSPPLPEARQIEYQNSNVDVVLTDLLNTNTILQAQMAGTNDSQLKAMILEESQVRATADSALATKTTTLEAQINGANDSGLKALIRDESLARVSSTEALASKTSTLEAQMNGTQSSAILARITDESTARVTALGALTTRSSMLEAQMAGTQNSGIKALVAQESTARVTALDAMASNITKVQAQINIRPNLVPNGSAERGIEGWTTYDCDIAASLDGGFGNHFVVTPKAGKNYITVGSPLFSVNPGTTYTVTGDTQLAIYTNVINSRFLFQWMSQANEIVGYSTGTVRSGQHKFSNTGEGRAQHASQVVAPANAFKARAVLVVDNFVDGSLTDCRLRQVKVEAGTLPCSPYSSESTFNVISAAIKTEELARTTADGALAYRALNLEAQMAGTYNSGIKALVVDEATSRVSATDALARRSTKLEAQMTGADGSGLKALVADETTARVTATNALATRSQVLEARTTFRPNLLKNGSFEDGKAGWYGNLEKWMAISKEPSWGSVLVSQWDIASNGTIISDRFPVGHGINYTVSGDLELLVESGSMSLTLIFYDSNDTPITSGGRTMVGPFDFTLDGSGQNKSFSTQNSLQSNTPAAYARVSITWSNVVNVSRLGIRQIKVEAGTQWSNYTSDSTLLDTTSRVSTVETATTDGRFAQATRVTTLEAQIRGDADSGVKALITEEQRVRVQADQAIAESVTTVASKIQIRPNLLINGGFEQGFDNISLGGVTGWNITNNVWGRCIDSYSLGASTGTIEFAVFPVQPGEWYTITGDSALFATAGVTYFDLLFLNSAMNIVGDGGEGIRSATHDFSNDGSGRLAHQAEAQAPAQAVWAKARCVWNGVTNLGYIGFRQVKAERGRLPYTAYTSDSTITSISSSIKDEAKTRSDATGALAIRSSTLEAQMRGDQDSGVLARVRDETQARVDATGALATRSNTLEAQMRGEQDSNLRSRISTVESATTDGRFASATRVSTLEATVSGSGGLTSRIQTTENAITGLNGKTSAYWQTETVAGNNRAQLRIHADANGGAGVDIIGDVSISGNLLVGGTVNTQKLSDNSVTRRIGAQLPYTVYGSGTGPGTGWVTVLEVNLNLPEPGTVIAQVSASQNYYTGGDQADWGAAINIDGSWFPGGSGGAGSYSSSFAASALAQLGAGNHNIQFMWRGGGSGIGLTAAALIVDAAMR